MNWDDCSLGYLCRTFDQLYRGQKYSAALPVIHIGFLDFQLFPEYPEFYAIHKLLNIKNHHLFSDKFTLSVVDLTQIELATEEDKYYQIDHWAKLFKATTWEEIKVIADKNEYMEEATQALFECNADELIRQQCYAREEYNRYQRTVQKALKDATQERDQALAELQEKDALLAKMEVENARLRALLDERK